MSKRLIDANELISAMYYYEHNEGGLTAYDAQDIINKAPSIDIVRCKECRRWATKYFEDGYGWCEHHINETTADDFCSHGKRREL